MFDIITFGSASRDIFIVSKDFKVVPQRRFKTKEGLCVPAESKLYVENVVIGTGGGGTNTAATFALQGFKVAYVGKVGQDEAGQTVIRELQDLGVAVEFISQTDKLQTMQSFILSAPGQARTILVYQGACNELTKEEIPFEKFKVSSSRLGPAAAGPRSNNNSENYFSPPTADLPQAETKVRLKSDRVEKPGWFYISSLSGHCAEVFQPLVDFAHKNKIKIAVNPGKSQLELGERIIPLLNKIDIFILNQEEASFLTGFDYQKEKEIFQKLDKWVQAIVVMTKGPKGVVVSDGRNLYKADIPKSGLVDRTGAGDAFGAGFVSGIIQGSSGAKLRAYREARSARFATPEVIEYAIQLGTANATSCLQQIGAKKGLLKKGEWGKWPKVEVKTEQLS